MQFIKQVVADLGPPKECRQFLKPIKLPNIYEVDPAFFKAKPATGPNRQRKPTEKKEKEENGDKDRPKSFCQRSGKCKINFEFQERAENCGTSAKSPFSAPNPNSVESAITTSASNSCNFKIWRPFAFGTALLQHVVEKCFC